jgi:hypothetical protein
MKNTLLLLLALIASGIGQAQNIGLGTNTPDNSAMLDIKASDKGILIPRVSTSGRNAIPGPAKGLLVYDTTLSRFYYHTGSVWAEVGNQPVNWSTAGNTGTGLGAALGTNDNANLFFKTNGYRSGAIFWGAQASATFGYAAAPNFSGSGISAFGSNALGSLTTGSNNTAVGLNSLKNTNTGYENTAVGSGALILNTTGVQNTAVGAGALFNNVANNFNTAVGFKSLYNTYNADYNVALGTYAGANKYNGYNNVFLGANTDVSASFLYNVIVIGQGTIGTASSQVTIGNSATNSYRVYANWTNISDGRYKKDMREDVPGLSFINALRPVTYKLDATGIDQFLHKDMMPENKPSPASENARLMAMKEKEQMRITGFVAQEVEKTAKGLGFDFSGIDAPKNDNDLYGLRYADFVVPLVKAVQEQQAIIEQQKKDIDSLKSQLALLAKKVEAMGSR